MTAITQYIVFKKVWITMLTKGHIKKLPLLQKMFKHILLNLKKKLVK